MTSLLPRTRTLFPDLSDWLDHSRPFGQYNLVRIEEADEPDRYVVRAELPGFDPATQIQVSAGKGSLTISAERTAKTEGQGRSEFQYGVFSRTVALPTGADAEKITANYANGVLEVSVPITERTKDKRIEITVGEQ